MKLLSLVLLLTCTASAADQSKIIVMADRSYYTTEEEAWLFWRGSGADAAGIESARVVDAAGKTLVQNSALHGASRLAMPLHDLSAGEHVLKMELQKAGATPVSCPVSLIKRLPKPGSEWKVDRLHQVLLRDGKSFFPYGIVMYGITAPRDAAAFEEVAHWGMNTVIRWYWCDPAKAGDYHNMAAKYKLQVIEPADRFSADNLTGAKLSANFDSLFEKNLSRISAGITAVADAGSLMCYYNFDEPLKGQVTSGRKLYAKIHELDGYHPALTLYSSSIPAGDEYLDWCDIVGIDSYWTPAGSGVRGNANYVSKNVALCCERAKAAGKVPWIMPMAEMYSGNRKRALLPREQFCQTYLALIHGAKGLIYFRYPVMHQATVAAMEALGKEMQVLSQVAVTPEIPQEIDYGPAGFDPEHNEFPDVQVSLRHHPSGGFVLLAANSKPYPVDAEFRLSILEEQHAVTHLFRKGELPVKNATFGERLEPMGTRAYVFPARETEAPVQISVRVHPHDEDPDPDYAPGVPDSGRPGKRNLLANPGFEAATFPDWPDYYLFSPERPRLGQTGAKPLFGLETAHPYEGKACLWMLSNGGSAASRVYTACAPRLTEAKPYVLSAWMRADHEGVKVRFVGFGWRVPRPTFGTQEITLGTSWQRYSEQGMLPPKLPDWHSVGVEIVGKQSAKVWIDAMQLEAGTEPTAYDP